MFLTTKVFALVAMAALVILTSLAGVSSATTTATYAPGGVIIALSSGLTFDAEGRITSCEVALNGTLSRAAVSIAGGSMGGISEVEVECPAGEVLFERALVEARAQWRVTSNRVSGPLPEGIRSIEFTVRATKWLFLAFFGIVRCLWEGDIRFISNTTRVGVSRYKILEARVDETSRLRFIRGSELCPREARLRGVFNVTAQTITFA